MRLPALRFGPHDPREALRKRVELTFRQTLPARGHRDTSYKLHIITRWPKVIRCNAERGRIHRCAAKRADDIRAALGGGSEIALEHPSPRRRAEGDAREAPSTDEGEFRSNSLLRRVRQPQHGRAILDADRNGITQTCRARRHRDPNRRKRPSRRTADDPLPELGELRSGPRAE